jgi:tripartite-type tricarboxylate transporter receptor subunit TctC
MELRNRLLDGTKALFTAAGCVVLAASWQAAHAAEWKDGKLLPLESGFPNKPLVLMVIDEPGSSDSVYATQLVEAANKLSPQPIKIEHRQDFSNFGTWEGLAWVRDQGELGNEGYISFVYTLQGGVIDLLVIDMKSEVGVGLDDLNAVIGTEQQPYVIHQRSDAPWGDTLEDFVEYAKENPGKVRHITGGPGGGQDAAMQYWVRQLGIEVNDIIGGGSGERALAVAAGEGDVTVSPVDVLLPHYQAGKVEPLMLSGKNPVPELFQGVPNAAEVGIENDPFDQTRAIAVSPEVPEENREWLFELFKAASEDADYQAKRKQVPGLTTLVLESDELRALAETGYEAGLPIMKELGVYWGDQ